MKKSFDYKKKAAAVTAVAVVAAGTVILYDASKLDKAFNPQSFGKFENNLSIGNDFNFVAGDGELSDLADDSKDGEARSSDKNGQEAIQAENEQYKKQKHSDNNDLSDNLPKNDKPNNQYDSNEAHQNLILASNSNQNDKINPNAVGISQINQNNGIDVNLIQDKNGKLNENGAENQNNNTKISNEDNSNNSEQNQNIFDNNIFDENKDRKNQENQEHPKYNENQNKKNLDKTDTNNNYNNNENSDENTENAENIENTESNNIDKDKDIKNNNIRRSSSRSSNGNRVVNTSKPPNNGSNNSSTDNNNSNNKPNGPINGGENNKPGGSSGDWENTQMTPGGSINTNYGKLLSLKIIKPENWTFNKGDTYRPEDIKVLAVFSNNQGTYEKEIMYGEDGYSVKISTDYMGVYPAVFNYKGMTASAEYTVLSNRVTLYYGGYINNSYYSAIYPGTIAENMFGNQNKINPVIYPSGNSFANLSTHFSRIIAYLGNLNLQNEFKNSTSGNYNVVMFPEENSLGYLDSMLTGFKYILNNTIQDNKSYINYPITNWDGNSGRNLISYVEKVPDNFEIKLEVKDKNTLNSLGEQVLVGYTGENSNIIVPMGVTSIRLEKENTFVKSLYIPESVREIDYDSIKKYFPNLEEFIVEEGNYYTSVDGILYSKNGRILLSVPPQKTKINQWSKDVTEIGENSFEKSNIKNISVPQTIETLGKNCFKDSHINTIHFKSNYVPIGASEMGYNNIVLVNDSKYDTIYKKWVIELGYTNAVIGVADTNGNQIAEKTGIYEYADGKIAVYSSDNSILAGISPDMSGRYIVPEGITSIGKGAFVSNKEIYEIDIPESVKELKEESLASLNGTEVIILSGDFVKISENVFGKLKDGEDIPNIKIYVSEKYYDEYLENWKNSLDPVYGDGTAENILSHNQENIIYIDNAKYQIISNPESPQMYRLLKVYDSNRKSFAVAENTVEIESDAFSYNDKLEIIYLPQSINIIREGAFKNCESLETVVVNSENSFNIFDTSEETTNIYTCNDIWSEYIYDDGIVYGISSDGLCTLIDVPTDKKEFVLRENTAYLYDNACKDCIELTNIEFSDTELKKIGSNCFKNCIKLSELNLSNKHTIDEIGDYAFSGCINLKNIGSSIIKKIGEGSFYNCENLTNINISTVDKISKNCFYNCSSLNISSLDSCVFIDDNAFAYCTSIQNLPELNNITSIGAQAFIGCSSITEVKLPESLEYMDESCFRDCVMLNKAEINGSLTAVSRYCFYGCRNLKDVSFGITPKKTLKFIGVQAFAKCASLEKLDFSELKYLSQIGEKVFEECESLTSVILPENLEKISDRCFESCNNLSIIRLYSNNPPVIGEFIFGDNISKFVKIQVNPDSLEIYIPAYTEILDSAYGDGITNKILDIYDNDTEIIQGVTYIKNKNGGMILLSASKELEGNFKVPENTIKIEDEAFKDCKKLTGIELPKNSNIVLGNRCFIGCNNLKTVYLYGDIPEWGDECFMDCTNIETVFMGSTTNNFISRIGTRAFKNCVGLDGTDAVTIRSKVSTLGEECFEGCKNIVGIPLNAVVYDSLEIVEDRAFAECTSLTNAFVSNKFKNLKSIGNYVYYNCDSLKQPSLPASLTEIGEGCFSECDNLQYVSIYGPVEEYPKDCFKNCKNLIRTGGTQAAFTALKRIGESAYEGCESLTISDSWNIGKYTNLNDIGSNAFKNCLTLGDIYLSENVKSIGSNTFENCKSISILEFKSSVPPEIGTIDLNKMSENFNIKVPDSKENNDNIYFAYLEKLTGILGYDNVINILDSISDEAMKRNLENSSEADTEISSENNIEADTEISSENNIEADTEISSENNIEADIEISSENNIEADTEISSENNIEADTEISSENNIEADIEISSENNIEADTEISSQDNIKSSSEP